MAARNVTILVVVLAAALTPVAVTTISSLYERDPAAGAVLPLRPGDLAGAAVVVRAPVTREDGDTDLARLLALPVPSASDRRAGVEEMRRALALTAEGKAEAAAQALSRANRLLPPMADWIVLLTASAWTSAGDTAEVRRQLERVDPELEREWGWRSRVLALRGANDPEAALRRAESAAAAIKTDARRAEAWRMAAELRLLRGDTAGGRDALLRALREGAQSEAANDAALLLTQLPLAPRETLEVGRFYVQRGNLERGVANLQAFLESGVGTAAERTQVRYELGRAYFRAARYDRAERALLRVAGDAKSPDVAAPALLMAARSQYRQKQHTKASATFLRVATRFPRHEAAAEALYTLADLEHDERKLKSARAHYRRAADLRPSSEHAGLAFMRLGTMAYLDGNLEAARKIFEEYRSHHANGESFQRATYWSAKTLRRQGRTAEAETRLREVRSASSLSYYGWRAAAMLGESSAEIDGGPSPAANAQAAAEVATGVFRLGVLRELELRESAVFELQRLRRYIELRPAGLYALAEGLNEGGWAYNGIRIGRELRQSEGRWNPRLLRIVYPLPYRDALLREAKRNGLDPYTVAGLIRQESSFNPRARSAAGAIGLMQIMPATGRVLASKAGIKNFNAAMLEDPETNLRLGTIFLADMMRSYARRPAAVFAAYNAGPSRVDAWRSRMAEYREDELFAERIPFAETREYVRIVQQNAQIYGALYRSLAAEPRGGG